MTTPRKVLRSLAGESFKVRYAAAEALGKIGAVEAVGPLIQILTNEDYKMPEAAYALGQIGDVRAVEPLIQILGNEDLEARKAAADALAQIGTPAVRRLCQVLGDGDEYARKMAAEALKVLADPQTTGPLSQALKDENQQFPVWILWYNDGNKGRTAKTKQQE